MCGRLSQEFSELIIEEANDEVDLWDFKIIPIYLLLYKYLSEDFCKYIKEEIDNEIIWQNETDEEFIDNIRKLKGLIELIGFFIHPNSTFSKIFQSQQLSNQWEKDDLYFIEKIEENLENVAENYNLKNLFKKNLVEKIKFYRHHVNKIIDWIEEKITPENYGEICKNLFENLINKCTKKEIYIIPNFVSEILKYIAQQELDLNSIKTIYDPLCKIGSMLINFVEDAKNCKFVGEEKNSYLNNLCKINLLLNGISFKNFEIYENKCIENDVLKNKKFELIVTNILEIEQEWKNKIYLESIKNDERFEALFKTPNKVNKEWLVITHCLNHLEKNGIFIAICDIDPINKNENINIKEWIIEKNYLNAIIKLPENLFFQKSQKISFSSPHIIVFKKNKTNSDTLFLDISEINEKIQIFEYEELERVVNLYIEKNNQSNILKLVSKEEIVKNKYDLSTNCYLNNFADIKNIRNKIQEHQENIEKLWMNIKSIEDITSDLKKNSDKQIQNFEEIFENDEEEFEDEKYCEYGDVLFWKNNENLTNVYVHLEHKKAIVEKNITVAKHSQNPTYLSYFFQSDWFKEEQNKEEILDFKNMSIPIIDKAIQEKISVFLDQHLKIIYSLKELKLLKEQELNYFVNSIFSDLKEIINKKTPKNIFYDPIEIDENVNELFSIEDEEPIIEIELCDKKDSKNSIEIINKNTKIKVENRSKINNIKNNQIKSFKNNVEIINKHSEITIENRSRINNGNKNNFENKPIKKSGKKWNWIKKLFK